MELYSSCFLGIPLPEHIRPNFYAIQHTLCNLLPQITCSTRWIPHITLYYLGSQPPEAIGEIMMRATKHIELLREEHLHIGSLGVFREGDPRVLYLQVHHSSRVEQFYRVLSEELASYRVEQVSRDFHPHVTIGRLPNKEAQGVFQDARAEIAQAADAFTLEMVIDKVVLYGMHEHNGSSVLAEHHW